MQNEHQSAKDKPQQTPEKVTRKYFFLDDLKILLNIGFSLVFCHIHSKTPL